MQQPSLQRDTAAIDTTGHLISGLNSETLGKNLQREILNRLSRLRDM